MPKSPPQGVQLPQPTINRMTLQELRAIHLQYLNYSNTETGSTSWRLKYKKKQTGWRDYVRLKYEFDNKKTNTLQQYNNSDEKPQNEQKENIEKNLTDRQR
eukprot:3112045-Amphidinium_carterae.1